VTLRALICFIVLADKEKKKKERKTRKRSPTELCVVDFPIFGG